MGRPARPGEHRPLDCIRSSAEQGISQVFTPAEILALLHYIDALEEVAAAARRHLEPRSALESTGIRTALATLDARRVKSPQTATKEN